MTRDSASPAPTAEEVLGAATVQVTGADGSVGGLGVVIAPTLVLTCAHVVLDALRLPREHADRPAAPVRVCLALGGGEESEAVVRDWVPERIGTVVRLTLAAPHR